MNNILNTPILFLIFNRPGLTLKVFERIKEVKPKQLFVSADGPRTEKEKELCERTRAIIKNVDWDCEVKTFFRNDNLGCKNGVSSGINWFFQNVEQGIIIEDDIYPDVSFFYYCEELLEKYKYNNNIYVIAGANFQNGIQRGNASYYFSKYAHIWGWASWRRAWNIYDINMQGYDKEKFPLEFKNIFISKSEMKYWNKIFERVYNNQINTWDYQWQYSIWKNKGISIIPNINLISNLGFENNSTHDFIKDSYINNEAGSIEFSLIHPQKIHINYKADAFTYNNIFNINLKRLLRLTKENGFRFFINLLKKKLFN